MSLSAYLDSFAKLLQKIDHDQVQSLVDCIAECYTSGHFVFIIGNGGSSANASHMCEDLGKGTLYDFENQKRLKVLSLTDNTPYILAWANDEGYERVFVEQLKNFATHGDLLIAISGSGNSVNVLRAAEWANDHGLTTFGVTGMGGGQLIQICRQSLHVPSGDMGVIESMHLMIFHYILDTLLERFRSQL